MYKRQDISGSYDKEIAKGQDKLKKARVKREKARNQGMQDRIAEETADLRDCLLYTSYRDVGDDRHSQRQEY